MAYIDIEDPTLPSTGLTGDFEIDFRPKMVTLSPDGNTTITATLLAGKETVVNATWMASIRNITAVEVSISKQSYYECTIEVDASGANSTESGDIWVTVTGEINATEGHQPFTAQGTVSYNLVGNLVPDIPIIPDSGSTEPIENTLLFSPKQLSITAGTSGVVNAILTSNKELSNAVWTVEDMSNTGVIVSLQTTGFTKLSTTVDASNVTSSTSGTLKFNLEYKYPLDNIGNEYWLYDYNILPIPVDSDPVLTLSHTSAFIDVYSYVTVTASISMNQSIITTDWSFESTGKQLLCTLENSSSKSAVLKLDSSNLMENETGTITLTANVLYLSVDGTQKRKSVSKSLNYAALAPTPTIPEVGEKGILIADPQSVIITKSPKVVTVNSSENVYEWSYTENQLLNVTILGTGYTFANFEVAPKTYNKDDSTIVVFRAYYDANKTVYTDIIVNVEMQSNKIIPVWEDSLIELDEGLGNRVEYKLIDVDTDEVVYSGKINKLPNGDSVSIDINKIICNYLSNPFPQITGNTTNLFSINTYSKTVDVVVGGSIVETVTVYNSWGYKDIPKNNVISDPIRKVVDRRQFFVCSVYNPTAIMKNVEYRLYKGNNYIYKYGISASNKKQTLLVDASLRNFGDYDYLKVGNVTYDIIDSCSEYCLYYSNAFGGWDSLLINGNTKKSDKISGEYYKQSYNNKTYQFGNTKYLNTITPSYVLYTDYFNDDEQSRLYHLLESTEVYLHNLNTNEFLPVNITNSTCEYTTYTNNGKKKWYNTINVEVAQDQLRK